MITLNEVTNKIRKIEDRKNYWFVRTHGGDFYHTFINGDYIAIGYDKILLSDVSRVKESPNAATALAEKVRKFYPENKRPGHTAKQILRFAYEIKKGDIVFVPSYASDYLTFGEVIETPSYTKLDGNNDDACPFEKRKKVKWFKTIKKWELDPNLYKLIYSHHTITNANDYDNYIDKTLFSFYHKKDKAHLVIDVKTTHGINGKDLFRFGLELLEIADEFNENVKENTSSDGVEAKVNLNSPGTVEFIANNISTLVVMGGFLWVLVGGEFEVNLRITKFTGKSKGLIKQISNFLDDSKNRSIKESLKSHIDKLEVTSPEDITKILNSLNNNSDEPEEE